MRLDHLLSMENVVTRENDVTVFDRRESKERLLFNFQGPSGQVGHINAEGPPVPIPNTEVKLCSGDNTLRATAREDSSMLTREPVLRKRHGISRKKKEEPYLGV